MNANIPYLVFFLNNCFRNFPGFAGLRRRSGDLRVVLIAVIIAEPIVPAVSTRFFRHRDYYLSCNSQPQPPPPPPPPPSPPPPPPPPQLVIFSTGEFSPSSRAAGLVGRAGVVGRSFHRRPNSETVSSLYCLLHYYYIPYYIITVFFERTTMRASRETGGFCETKTRRAR